MNKTHIALSMALLLTGCASPKYIDSDGEDTSSSSSPFSDVIFHVYDAYKENSPDCVAVLPFKIKFEGTEEGISIDQAEAIRRSFYAHLAPQGKRDVELPRIDFVLSKMSQNERDDPKQVGRELNCSTLVNGSVTEYGSSFYGVYSRVAVGADLSLVRAKDGEILWKGSHVAQSHGGSVPLSPIGLAMGIMEASNNVREEQIYRIIDDLARRLVSTIPDDRISVLDEPLTPVMMASSKPVPKPGSMEEFLASLDKKAVKEQKAGLLEAIKDERFGDNQAATLYEKLIAITPDEPDGYSSYAHYLVDKGDYSGALKQVEQSLALNDQDHSIHFLKGRVLIKLDDLDGADKAIVKAAAFDETNAKYLNGLGYVNSLRGNDERALAAYRIAIERDPVNGFAYYNTGVTLYNLGDLEQAADAFYGAGLAYIKTKNYGPATKTLTDLKNLTESGIERTEEIKTLEEALLSLTKGEDRDV